MTRTRLSGLAAVTFDPAACRLVAAAAGTGFTIAYQRGPGLVLDVRPKASTGPVLQVRGVGDALSVDSTAPPFAVAAVLLALRDATGLRPRCVFPWPSHPRLTAMFGLTGRPAQVRAVLRRSEPDPRRRPLVVVGD